MGSNFNFKSFGYDPPVDGGGGSERPPGNFPLTRKSSVYSLTFDKFQSTVAGSGKNFGSMNMDELLKSIWSAEENQNNGSTSGVGGSNAQVGLQRQGSLTLPKMISQKTVDEVWKDMSKEYGGAKGASGGIVGFGVPHREPTLGEITLEEFLARAGVVREEAQLNMKANNNDAVFGDFSRAVNNSGLGFEFLQQFAASNSNQMGVQSGNLSSHVNGVRSQVQQQAIREQPQQQQIIPKQSVLSYGAPMGIPTSQLGSPRISGGIARISDQVINNTMVQNVALQGMVNMSVAAGSPAVSSDGITKSNENTPSASPVPCVFNGGLRGRKTAILEKVVERRQRRMIKNRESAARSRARKQAYTTELEAEVAKLKEENEELRKKQEIMKMQKNEVLEMMNQRNGAKRRCLRRTQTGIW